MNRRPRIRRAEITVAFTPVEASPEEYDEAWVGAMAILHRLSQRLPADRTRGMD